MGYAEARARQEQLRAAGQLPGAKGTDTRVELRTGAAAKPKPVLVPLVVRAACVHEGAVVEFCTRCSGELRHVRDCALHERCTRGAVSPLVRACATCADYVATSD